MAPKKDRKKVKGRKGNEKNRLVLGDVDFADRDNDAEL